MRFSEIPAVLPSYLFLPSARNNTFLIRIDEKSWYFRPKHGQDSRVTFLAQKHAAPGAQT